jgi:3-oxoadipate enol-lactonase
MPVLSAHGETIHYRKEGAGPAVVLIHSLGANSALWLDQIAALKDRYTAIAFDCRGHGGSSANGEASVEAAATDLAALLDHLGVTQCHLVGLSMGGPIALLFNAAHPGVARSLVLADTFAKAPEGGAECLAATREALAYISMREFGLQYAGERLMPGTSLDVQDRVADWVAAVPVKAYLETMKSVLTGDFTATLSAVTMPALVLAGENDTVAPPALAEALARAIPGARLEIIPEAVHLANLDNPGAFNTTLAAFLDAERVL